MTVLDRPHKATCVPRPIGDAPQPAHVARLENACDSINDVRAMDDREGDNGRIAQRNTHVPIGRHHHDRRGPPPLTPHPLLTRRPIKPHAFDLAPVTHHCHLECRGALLERLVRPFEQHNVGRCKAILGQQLAIARCARRHHDRGRGRWCRGVSRGRVAGKARVQDDRRCRIGGGKPQLAAVSWHHDGHIHHQRSTRHRRGRRHCATHRRLRHVHDVCNVAVAVAL